MHRFEWPEDGSSSSSYGDWIRLLRGAGFEIERLVELCAPRRAHEYYSDFVTAEWARNWPMEEIWVARKTR